MTNIKMSTTNDLYEYKYMTMDVIYVSQLLISLQFTGISFSSHTIAFCACYFCVLGITRLLLLDIGWWLVWCPPHSTIFLLYHGGEFFLLEET